MADVFVVVSTKITKQEVTTRVEGVFLHLLDANDYAKRVGADTSTHTTVQPWRVTRRPNEGKPE